MDIMKINEAATGDNGKLVLRPDGHDFKEECALLREFVGSSFRASVRWATGPGVRRSAVIVVHLSEPINPLPRDAHGRFKKGGK